MNAAGIHCHWENPKVANAVLRMIAGMYRRERECDERKLEPAQRLEERLKPDGIVRTMASLKRLALWT